MPISYELNRVADNIKDLKFPDTMELGQRLHDFFKTDVINPTACATFLYDTSIEICRQFQEEQEKRKASK